MAEVLAHEPSVLVLDARGAVLTCAPTALQLFEGSIDKIRGVEIPAFFDDPSVWAELVAGALGGIMLSASGLLAHSPRRAFLGGGGRQPRCSQRERRAVSFTEPEGVSQ